MAAATYKKYYTNEADYIYDLAKTDQKFSAEVYNSLSAIGKGEDYAYAIAGTKNKVSDTFNMKEYNYLNDEDKLSYILNEYYIDKEKDSDIYKQNREYLDYRIQEGIDAEIYESLNWFEKTINTIGGFIGNAFNELILGTIEGLIDLGATLVGQKEFAAQDFTGVSANREALARFNRAYTYIDKSKVLSVANDVVTGLVKMAPLLIPYAGQAIYFGAMAGNTAEEAIRANPDIDYLSLITYTAAVTGVELATEKISSFIFGGSAIDKLVFKSTTSKAGSWITRVGLDFLSEGFEEAVSEFADSVLYTVMVDPEAPLASITDCLYAGLVGGLIGGIAAGGQIATTRKVAIASDGSIIDAKTAKEAGLDVKSLSKAQTLNLQERLAAAKNAIDSDAVADLQAKYSTESLQEIQENHAEEYQQALSKNEEFQSRLAESALALNKVMEMAGIEGFQKASELANYTIEKQAELARNYTNKLTGTTSQNRAVEAKFKQANPDSSIQISDTLTTTEQRLKDGLKKLYGKDVFFAVLGEKDGIVKKHGLTLDENTIILEKGLSETMSINSIMETVVKEELVHTLQYQSGILTAETINDLLQQYNELGGAQVDKVQLDEAYRNKSELTKLSEAQAKALAQVLLFDKLSVSRIFVTNNSTFNKVYKWMLKAKEGIEALKNRKSNADKIKYRQLLQSMEMYREVVAEHIGNEEDALIAKSEMSLTDEQLQKLVDTYLPDYSNEHYTLLTAQYTIHTEQRMAAEKTLSGMRKDINKLLPLSYRMVFNPEYYNSEFVQQILSRNTQKDFRYNLNEYMITEFGFAISDINQCLMEVVDLNRVTTQDFDATLATLSTDPNALNKYTTLEQIFGEEFNRKFVDETGYNHLSDVTLKFIPQELSNSTQAEYVRFDPETKGHTIKVYLNAEGIYNTSQIDALKHKIFHETTHALADIQGLQNGTSTNYVRSALDLLNNNDVQKLGKLLLTKEFYEANKTNISILKDNIAYGIYRITDGEYAAEGYKSSITRKGDIEVNLKAGATMNRSGFRTDGTSLYGYGRFSGIVLEAPQTITQAKRQYSIKNLQSAVEVTSYASVNEFKNSMAEKGITDFEKAGFSDDFVSLLESDRMTTRDMWDMINSDTVGTPEATNQVIQWLAPDNTSIKTIEDVERAKTLGIPYAVVYNELRLKNDPNYNKKAKHTYDAMENFFTKNPNQFNKVMKQQENIAKLLDKTNNSQINQWLIKTDYGYSANSTQKLLGILSSQYGINSRLATEKITTEQEATLVDTKATEAFDTEVKETPSFMENVKSVDDVIKGMKENMTKIGDSQDLFALRNLIEKNKQTLIKQFGEDGYKAILAEAPTSKGTYTKQINRLKKAIEQRPDFKPLRQGIIINEDTSDFTPKQYEDFIERLEKMKNKEIKKVEPSTKAEVKIPSEILERKATPEEIKQELTNENGTKKTFYKGMEVAGVTEFDPSKGQKFRAVKDANWFSDNEQVAKSYATKQGRIYSVELDVKNPLIYDAEGKVFSQLGEGKFTTDQLVAEAFAKGYDSVIFKNVRDVGAHGDSKGILSTNIAVKGNAGITITGETAKTIDQQIKDASPSENINPKKPSTITQGILDFLSQSQTGISDVQYTEMTNDKYTQLSYNMINNHLGLFSGINDSNYEAIRQELVSSGNAQALNLFDLYTKETSGAFNAEIAQKINDNYGTMVSQAGQRLALQSRLVANRKPISDLVKGLSNDGYTVKVSDEIIQEYDARLKDKDAYIEDLTKRIKALQEEIKSSTNVLDQQVLYNELRKTSEEKNTIQNGTNIDIMDWIIDNAETLNEQAKLQKNFVNRLLGSLERAQETGKQVGIYLYGKDGTEIKSFPEAREKITKLMKSAKSFRMWAMLSSPVTWARNWVGNMGMKALDGMTNALERQITKRMNLMEGQMAYNESRAGKSVYNHISETQGEYIMSLVRGEHTKYGEVSSERAGELKRMERAAEYEGANAFRKACLKAQDMTDWGLSKGPLGDEPVVYASICKNMGNLVASNVDFLLIGIENEAQTLRGKEGLSETKQNRLEILEKALKTKNATDVFDALSKEEMGRLFDNAKSRSFEQYFKNQNWLSKKFSNLGAKHPIMAEIVSWVMPFPKVAANVLTMAYRYSPLNFINAISQASVLKQMSAQGLTGTGFEQAKFARTLSEATTGTFMLIAGAVLAALGFVDIDDDDYLGPCLNFGGVRISLSNLAPSMTTFSTAAAMIWGWKQDGVGTGMKQALNTLYDNTLLGNIDNLFKYNSLDSKFFENLSISYLSQYIPAVLKLVNKSILQSPQKDKTGSYFTKLIKTLGSYIPGISTFVPDKIDPYTGKKVYASGSENWFLNFLAGVSPLTIKYTQTSALEQEATALGAKTSGLSGKFTVNGTDVNVTNKDKEKLAKYRANYIETNFNEIKSGKQKVTVKDEKTGKMITTTYDKLNDKQKANVLTNLYSKATDAAKVEWWTSQGNYYYATTQDEYNRYRTSVTNKSNIRYSQNWNKSKFIER